MTHADHESLLAAARTWAAEDPDPHTTAELEALLAQVADDDTRTAATQDLQDRFSGPLLFGTAGLRAALGAGPNRMNRVVVRRAAAGLAAHVTGSAEGAYVPRAVVGFDARHNSRIFAEETAAIFTAAGIQTFLMPSELPTPVLAYAVRALECEVGVMVTASHNPPQDNGYKVYLGGRAVDDAGRGAQIVAPQDTEIAARIAAVGQLGSILLAAEGWNVLPESIAKDYVTSVVALADRERFPDRDLSIVLTPMHGVGGTTAQQVLAAAGFGTVHVVAEQADPDPDFPTVDFPNPEEPGALDLAIAAALAQDADLVLANDPDADRVAVAAKDPATGEWRMLRGDETGALLGQHLAVRRAQDTGEHAAGTVFANSIVSSRLLSRIAATAGIPHTETLTGFKWISRVPSLAYGYEEALGYCVAPDLVRDKDGISAALLLAELAAATKAEGRTLFDLLDDLALLHGLHASDQLSVRVGSLGLLDAMMNRLRENPPQAFADSAVDVVQDLLTGYAGLPPTDGLLYLTRDDTRVIIRPSGTEPKLKCYLEVIEPVELAAELDDAKLTTRARLDAVLCDVEESLGL
ncbi:phospho-sugar mutase [Arthrobacter sp. TB 23]|uniref:phospho-sugar mutase n=1 Tax=Arthrobacter sp. TB 23 TaxID=494419 RepID=UPI0002E86F49|nr:phospho-sugar mutase [Arthrobacter sp. TB 23]